MTKYLFGDLVRNCKEKVDRDNNPYEYFVAGDHMETERPKLTMRGRFDESDVGPAFIRMFKPGQVLYGSRRTYLKKVSVADFEGVTSNVTFVLETKDESILPQTLLPFLLLSDRFTSYSIGKSKGSTNPYVLFSDLADFEIDLPEPKTVAEIADIMCAAERLKENYRSLIATCDDVVKSQFVEMFGDPRTQTEGLSKLGDHVQIVNGFAFKGELFCDSGIPVIKIANVNSSTFTHDSMKFYKYDESLEKFSVYPGDLLISLTGTVGKDDFAFPCIVDNSYEKYYLNQRNAKLIPSSNLAPTYLLHLLKNEFIHERLVRSGTGVRQCHLHNANIEAVSFKLPPIKLQQEFATFAAQVDKSKFKLGICGGMP